MSSYLSMLLDLDSTVTAVPSRLLSQLSRHANYNNILGIAIRIAVVGLLASTIRRLVSYLSAKINRGKDQIFTHRFESRADVIDAALFPTAYILASDQSYLWVMAWMAQDQEAQKQIKDFELSTSEWRLVRRRGANSLHATGSKSRVGEQNATWSAKDIIGQVLPTYSKKVRIRHQCNYLWVSRRMHSFARTTYRNTDHVQITTIAFQRNALKDFLSAAHEAYFSKENNELLIFHAKRIHATWQKPVSRPSRPWGSVILPGNMKDELITDIEKFLSEKETTWYAARGIPHRRGYLFHGDPGAGKTTLATAIASKLHLDVYVVNPAQRGMDDAKLSKLFRDCPAKSIILIEDIDCIFPRNRYTRPTAAPEPNPILADESDSVHTIHDDAQTEVAETRAPMVGGSHDLAPSTVTLSGLLNAIDGVSSQEGCVLVGTTNYPDRLDPALGRAGRFDVHIPFFPAVPEQARALFLHFYPLEDFASTDDSTSAGEKAQPKITSHAEVEALADNFTEGIFGLSTESKSEKSQKSEEGLHVSMAALQGYLLGYKEDPMAAADRAEEWAKALQSKKA